MGMTKQDILAELLDMAGDYVELLSTFIMDEDSQDRYDEESERLEKIQKELDKMVD